MGNIGDRQKVTGTYPYKSRDQQ